MYIIYTPNLGLAIAIFDREREQGRFKGSNERARGRNKGASREHRGSIKGIRGVRGSIIGQCRGAVGGSLTFFSIVAWLSVLLPGTLQVLEMSLARYEIL